MALAKIKLNMVSIVYTFLDFFLFYLFVPTLLQQLSAGKNYYVDMFFEVFHAAAL